MGGTYIPGLVIARSEATRQSIWLAPEDGLLAALAMTAWSLNE
jgi:hypothetical protein